MQTAEQINLPQVGSAWYRKVFSPFRSKPPIKSTTTLPIQTGLGIVYGVPEKIQPIHDCPPGRMRLRFRQRKAGMAYFKTPGGIRSFIIERRKGQWFINPKLEQGRNVKL
jgi:hypothetical protein